MILILGPMESEIKSIRLAILEETGDEAQVQEWATRKVLTGRLAGQKVTLTTTGVGKVNAAMTSQHFIDCMQPRAVILVGLAGALNAYFERGDTIVATDLVQHDVDATGIGFARGQIPFENGRFFACDRQLLALAKSYSPPSGSVFAGRICSGDIFLSSHQTETFAYLHSELAADAVEMEGAAIAQVCSAHQVPFLVSRTISDKANQEAKLDFEQFLPQADRNSLAFLQYLLPKMAPT